MDIDGKVLFDSGASPVYFDSQLNVTTNVQEETFETKAQIALKNESLQISFVLMGCTNSERARSRFQAPVVTITWQQINPVICQQGQLIQGVIVNHGGFLYVSDPRVSRHCLTGTYTVGLKASDPCLPIQNTFR